MGEASSSDDVTSLVAFINLSVLRVVNIGKDAHIVRMPCDITHALSATSAQNVETLSGTTIG